MPKSIDPLDGSNRLSDTRWHSDWENGGSTNRPRCDPPTNDESVAQKVRSIQRARTNRSRLFDPELFADPAWDILLDLFASSLEQRRVSVSGLCAASGVPATTALRWMATLEAHELILRLKDPLDARRVFVMLSGKGSSIMREYFQTLSPGALPI